jgi:membrane associated rhomboid family serine protease
VKDANLMTNNLVDVSRRMARAKKFDADWLFFGIPAIILWLGWFAYESYLIAGNIEQNWLMYGGIIGGIIGAICGFSIHFKTQRQYQDIIDQIEDLTAEN